MHAAPSTSGTAVYPVGPAFHAHARRILNNRSFQEDDKLERERLAALGNGDEVEDDVDADLGGEDEDEDLLELDPKRWKDQDHYAVLGLQHLRYKADQEQIKKARTFAHSLAFSLSTGCAQLTHARAAADRRKVLRHHPDKKANAGGSANDDSFFKCIAKGEALSLSLSLPDDSFPGRRV